MKWPWASERDPASGECQHSFTNWSAPTEREVTSYPMFGSSSYIANGLIQDRHCLKCNLYERRCIA